MHPLLMKENVKKIIDSYKSIMDMIHEDCMKYDVKMVGFFYFREGDIVEEVEKSSYYTQTDITDYDAYYVEKSLKNRLFGTSPAEE